MSYRIIKLSEVGTIDRAKDGKIYPKGTILIGLSATSGEVKQLSKAGTIPTKYAAVELDSGNNPIYIYNSVLSFFPEFFARYKTGMNLRLDALAHLEIGLHDRETQDEYVKRIELVDADVEISERELEQVKELKRYYLGKLFL